MSGIKALAGVARVPFLLLPVTLVAAGGGAAYYDGVFSWSVTLLALAGLVALHMAVNIFNEWSDMRTGIDMATERTPFSGGSGTLPSGAMSSRGAFIFGVACSAVGIAVGLWFYAKVGMVLVPFLAIGAVCVLAYTDLLARLGIGEVAAGLGLGLLPVMGTAVVNTGEIGTTAVAAGIPAAFMTFNLLLLNEFPDEKADRIGGRRHLVILFGRPGAALVFAAAAIGVPLSIVISVAVDALPAICLVGALPSLLLAKPLRWAFSDPSQAVPIPALGANVIWNLTTNTLIALALIVAAALQ
jgi:1,4-dihydroxy-2-naphthoate octaprenyltransferase